ncbi:MAG: hypothetical protein K0R61_3326, partial [Microvirga sp.]|nr:hypothetical protein [Microvirga sp.]
MARKPKDDTPVEEPQSPEQRRQQAEGRSQADEVHDAGGARNEAERGPQPEPGPDEGEKYKAIQALKEGSEEKEQERTRVDPETGETLVPNSAHEQQKLALERQSSARSGGSGSGFSRAAETAELIEDERGGDPMLHVARNVAEEQVELVRAADLPGEGVDPAKKYADKLGGPGAGAPVAEPSGGRKHHEGAPWPAPLTPSCSAPTPSPEPGPEPDQQWNPPQNITFADHDAAVRGTLGPSREEQVAAAEAKADEEGRPGQKNAAEIDLDPSADEAPKKKGKKGDVPRNSVGKIPHTHIADKAIEAAFKAFGSDPVDHGKVQQALLHAQRQVRAHFYRLRKKHA